jgi:drug/metabolite transporter (DMT)-like permease
MIGTVPIIGLILGTLFLKEKCGFLQGFFTVLSVLGVYLTTSGGFGNISAKGFAFLLGAAFSAALFTILSRKISEHFSAFERTYVMFLLGSAVFIPLAIFEQRNDLGLILKPLSEPLFLLSVFYLAVVSSVCAFLFINYSLNYIPAGRALVFSNFTTVISVLAGIFIMGDSFSLTQLFGIAVITLSVFGVSYRKNPAK